MPYHLARKGDEYWVVDEAGKKHSKGGLDKATARKQMIALNIAHAKKEGAVIPPPPKRSFEPLKSKDCDPKCERNKIAGDVGILHHKLTQMFNPAPAAVAAPVKKMELVSRRKGGLKGDLGLLHHKLGQMMAPAKLQVQSMALADFEPKKKALVMESLPVADVPALAQIPQLEVSEVRREGRVGAPRGRPPVGDFKAMLRDDPEEAIRHMSADDWKTTQGKQRKKIYETISSKNLPVPAFIKRGYEGWRKK